MGGGLGEEEKSEEQGGKGSRWRQTQVGGRGREAVALSADGCTLVGNRLLFSGSPDPEIGSDAFFSLVVTTSTW